VLGRGRSSTGYGCRGAEEKTHGEKGARNIYIIGEDLSKLVPERTVNRTAGLLLQNVYSTVVEVKQTQRVSRHDVQHLKINSIYSIVSQSYT